MQTTTDCEGAVNFLRKNTRATRDVIERFVELFWDQNASDEENLVAFECYEDELQTARLWKLVELFHKKEADFHHDLVHDANDNHWTLNAYQNDIMTAGCHRIAYEEMRNAAHQLGIAA